MALIWLSAFRGWWEQRQCVTDQAANIAGNSWAVWPTQWQGTLFEFLQQHVLNIVCCPLWVFTWMMWERKQPDKLQLEGIYIWIQKAGRNKERAGLMRTALLGAIIETENTNNMLIGQEGCCCYSCLACILSWQWACSVTQTQMLSPRLTQHLELLSTASRERQEWVEICLQASHIQWLQFLPCVFPLSPILISLF